MNNDQYLHIDVVNQLIAKERSGNRYAQLEAIALRKIEKLEAEKIQLKTCLERIIQIGEDKSEKTAYRIDDMLFEAKITLEDL